MFQIVCDPSSGSTELYLTEIHVWYDRLGTSEYFPAHHTVYTHTIGSKLHCQTLTKHTTNISEPL